VGDPAAPGNEPAPRPQEPAPPVKEGFTWKTPVDWFLKFTNIRELANADHHERLHMRISLALSLASAVTLGWYHTTTLLGSLTHIKGPDLKLGLVAYLGFINNKKTEIIKGNKNEYIYGWKYQWVTGKKNKMGSFHEQQSRAEYADFKNKCSEYWTLRKELAKQLKETIATLNKENASVAEEMKKCLLECDKAKVDSTDASVRASNLKAQIGTLQEQASSAKIQASSDFKVIGDSAAEFLASASWDGDFGSELKMVSSLQKLSASLSKLG
jgi:hypothetical protein